MGDTLHQIVLTVEEQQKAGDHIDRCHGEGQPHLACIDLREIDGQRLLCRVRP